MRRWCYRCEKAASSEVWVDCVEKLTAHKYIINSKFFVLAEIKQSDISMLVATKNSALRFEHSTNKHLPVCNDIVRATEL